MRSELRRHKVVGDSNGWTMCMVPEVDKKIPIHLIIHLVRNGIQNVHSMFYAHTEWSREDWIYTHFFRRYWKVVGSPMKDWDYYTDWEKWCFDWSLNLTMPVWMKERLGEDRVLIYRLEDLTSTGDVETLSGLIQRLDPSVNLPEKALKLLQREDINRKVHGDRRPEVLWRQWTDEQREAFLKICAAAMEHFGYEIPPRP